MHFRQEYINTHFSINPDWKSLYNRNFPNASVEEYIANAEKLFIHNGYEFKLERYSNNPSSKFYSALKSIEVFKGEEYIDSRGMVNEHSAVEQVLIQIICDFMVDFRTFKNLN